MSCKVILKVLHANYTHKLRIYNFVSMQRLVNKNFSFTVKILWCIVCNVNKSICKHLQTQITDYYLMDKTFSKIKQRSPIILLFILSLNKQGSLDLHWGEGRNKSLMSSPLPHIMYFKQKCSKNMFLVNR